MGGKVFQLRRIFVLSARTRECVVLKDIERLRKGWVEQEIMVGMKLNMEAEFRELFLVVDRASGLE